LVFPALLARDYGMKKILELHFPLKKEVRKINVIIPYVAFFLLVNVEWSMVIGHYCIYDYEY
jgi:hypothetical protein